MRLKRPSQDDGEVCDEVPFAEAPQQGVHDGQRWMHAETAGCGLPCRGVEVQKGCGPGEDGSKHQGDQAAGQTPRKAHATEVGEEHRTQGKSATSGEANVRNRNPAAMKVTAMLPNVASRAARGV